MYGLKPSSGRLPYHGVKGHFFAGAEVTGILCVSGVIAVSLRDCELLLRTISESQPWLEDPSCSFLPWKPMDPIRLPLVVGVISDEPATTLLPPVRRVLEETANCVRMAGHEVIELEFHKCAELNQVALNFAKIDGGRVSTDISSADLVHGQRLTDNRPSMKFATAPVSHTRSRYCKEATIPASLEN